MDEFVGWDDLLLVYENSIWLDGEDAQISIVSQEIIDVLKVIDSSTKNQRDANIFVEADLEALKVGDKINARIGPPTLRLGLLAQNWNSLLDAPNARLRAIPRFFVKEDGARSPEIAENANVESYKRMVDFANLLSKAALFVDQEKQSFVFFKDRRIEVPINYSESDFGVLTPSDLSALEDALSGETHQDQRLEILANAVSELAASQPTKSRYIYLIVNADEIVERVREGYRLFASSFSYSKIRGEVETALSDFIGRIHKTFVDIQGQLLGLPIASIVVASQLKSVKVCSPEAWGNLAILAGAWLFAALLVGSCVNQWNTLTAISNDIGRQKSRLKRDFNEVAQTFLQSFSAAENRICWHRVVLAVVIIIAIAGAILTTIAFRAVTGIGVLDCI